MIKKIPKDRSSNAARTRGGIVGIKFSQALFIYLFSFSLDTPQLFCVSI